ncbi:glycosyltransferase family 1 protein [Rhodococcus sp. X156]|uniref:glycosyltransferase family 4 protein n=1 Tax=Rhodococcus sp. X156 TaxID=2499145 RepID=UPI0013E32ABE|nr:glycosyltransferase family 1 protein [Rhodococcus sp. X156]
MLNALFLDPAVSGGPETYLHGLAPALHAAVPDMELAVATTRRGARALRDAGWDSWCEVAELPCDEGQRAQRLFAEQVLLPAEARRRGVDVLHSLASLGPVWTPQVRHVATLHDLTFIHEKSFGRATTAAFRLIVRGVAVDVDAAVTGTAVARDDIAKVLGLRQEGFVVAHHGRQPVAPGARDGETMRDRLGLVGKRVVLSVGAKRPHKNQELLLKALPKLPSDVHVVLVGHPEAYDANLRDLAQAVGIAERVTFLDYVSDTDLESLWALASCAAFPTRAEGFGLPLIEAMERGVAVACSDIPVLREVGGEVPRYFPVDDPAACAAAILDSMDGANRLLDGRDRAAQFTWSAAAEATLSAYARAMQRPATLGRGRALVEADGHAPTPDESSDWADAIGGSDRSLLGRMATAGKRASLPVAARAARVVRRAAGVRTFTVGGRELEYSVHGYNETWRNERAVELPIAFDWLDRRPQGPVLEIGHVIGHYRPDLRHTVVDLYEPAEGVLNVDAVDFAPAERFRSIVAVSTLEHVGFDEDDQDPDKTRRLVEHLATLLTDDGELLVTFPLGYNRYLDDHLLAGALGFDQLSILRRVTTLGEWVEGDLADVRRARYGFPFHHGNTIAVGRRSARSTARSGERTAT